MIKLRQILNEIIQELKDKHQYDPKDIGDENLFDSYIMLAELLDPNDAYPYTGNKEWYKYEDINGNEFHVRLAYMPASPEFWELKTWWMNDKGRPIYDKLPPNVTVMDWDKRSNTVAKIFRDELLPLFKSQNLSNLMYVRPIDSKRYYFSMRLLKKFIPKDWEIIEDFPKKITVVKK